MEQPIQQESVNGLLTEFGTRLIETEEKQRLIKERTLLLGKNLIVLKNSQEKQETESKKRIFSLEIQIKEMEQIINRLVESFGDLAKRSEVEIIENQLKMFEPLKYARIKDIKRMVQKEMVKNK
jgi:hypothetical protein